VNLGIEPDGGPEIGLGHLVRTGALASECLRHGHDVTYLTRTPATVDAVCPAVDTEGFSPGTTLSRSLKWLDAHQVDVVLTDSYDADLSVQEAIHDRVPVLAVVVDDNRHAIRADLVVNGNVYAPNFDYQWLGTEPGWCLGTDFLLFRDKVRAKAREPASFRQTPPCVILTMGGSDVGNTTPVAMSAFDGLDVVVDVIVGPGASITAYFLRSPIS
jgi:spore coat polysaccharide biosynthesis predicted glycosyltransferase SpsG